MGRDAVLGLDVTLEQPETVERRFVVYSLEVPSSGFLERWQLVASGGHLSLKGIDLPLRQLLSPVDYVPLYSSLSGLELADVPAQG